MKCLVVNNNQYSDDTYRNLLYQFTDDASLVFVHSIDDAIKFISEEIIDNNKYIDLIICNYYFGYLQKTAQDLLLWIRNISNIYYFNSNLKLDQIPIILAYAPKNYDYVHVLKYNGSLSYQDIEEGRLLDDSIARPIKTWVDTLLGDYDKLGISPYIVDDTLFPNIPYIYNCRILSPDYCRCPIKLDILSFQQDIDSIERTIELFSREVVRISKLKSTRQEDEYHRLLKNNPVMILGNSHSSYWHETSFNYLTNDKRIRPDFILKPYYYSYTNTIDILEIKLPKEKLLINKKFQETLSTKLVHSLTQAKDYKRYFTDQNHHNEINKRLDTVPKKANYTLLIGRTDERNDFYKILNDRLNDFGLSDILVLTYDELIKGREKIIKYRSLYRVDHIDM